MLGGLLSSNVSKLGSKEVIRHAELVSASQMQERGAFSRNNKTLSRISKFTSFTKKFFPLPEVEGKCAYTLAEVLITLGIIGVVAAITLPSLIQHNVEKQRVAQLKKAYSELSQAFLFAVDEHGAPTEWGMGSLYEPHSHYILADNMRKYLKLSKDCVDMTGEQTQKVCGYDGLYSDPWQYTEEVRRLVVLNNGTAVNFRVYTGNCNVNYGEIKNVCGTIDIDLNGAKGPNRNGEDKFEIFLTRDKLVPAGIPGDAHDFETACNRLHKHPYPEHYGEGNMYACTAWVLYNENMDYLHCDDLSWSGKTKCK